MNSNFEPIRLVDLNTKKTRPSPTAPTRSLLSLQLSDLPPDKWAEIFSQERQFPRDPEPWHLLGRVWLEGDCIVADCVPEELERHLDELKISLDRANAAYKNFLIKQSFTPGQEPEQHKIQQARLEKIRARLNLN
jgi:hypothetical protein